MKPGKFSYEAPRTLDEALHSLATWHDNAKIIAGGQSLAPMLNMRLARPDHLIDINRLTELGRIVVDGGQLTIGAMARHAQLARDALVKRHAPMLAHAAETIGHYAIRQRGTIGGSLAHADPAAQLPLATLALDAEFALRSAAGTRTLSAGEFFLSVFTTALEPDELLAAIHVPVARPREGWGFRLFNRRAGDFAIVAVAATVARGEGTAIERLRFADRRHRPGAGADRRSGAAGGCRHHSPRAGRRGLRQRWLRRSRSRTTKEYRSSFGVSWSNGSCAIRSTTHWSVRREYGTGAHHPRGQRRHLPRRLTEPRRLLSDVLREDCGLTGTHVGCEHGVCGACTILFDGAPARACLIYAVQAEGHEITTIEGFAADGELSVVQQALHEEHGLQCGFCTPGIVVTMEAWLGEHPEPTEAEVRDALTGNLCRCTGYHNIVAAILKAAARRRVETHGER